MDKFKVCRLLVEGIHTLDRETYVMGYLCLAIVRPSKQKTSAIALHTIVLSL